MASRPYHHGDLRDTLVEAGLALLEAEGIEALSLRELARRVGVSHAAPSHHFPDKRALLAALAAHGFATLAEQMDRATSRAGDDPVRRLTAAGVAYVRFALAHPRLFRLMFGSDFDERDHFPDLAAAGDVAFAVLLDAAEAALQSRGDHDPDHLVLTVAACWSSVHGLATLAMDGRLRFAAARFPSVDVLTRRVTDLLARALTWRAPA
jgi:AcrR family transcriptional regulator